MNKEDFSKLPLNEQANYVWGNGEFILMKEYYNQSIALYSAGRNFYAVWYISAFDEIVKVTQSDVERVSKIFGKEI